MMTKTTTVRIPEELVQDVMTEFAFTSKQQMMLWLVDESLRAQEQRKSITRILDLCPDLAKLADPAFRAQIYG